MSEEFKKCKGFLPVNCCKDCKRQDEKIQSRLVMFLLKNPATKQRYCNFKLTSLKKARK